MTNKINKPDEHNHPFNDKRSGADRRQYKKRRAPIRFEAKHRKNHGRRQEDKDP
nr:hypothetical protein [uncultured Amphritea sp.]